MKYVILGASAAGLNAVRELRRLDTKGEILLVSEEETGYSRCMLHYYLSGVRSENQLNFVEDDFEDRYRVLWLKGRRCISVNPEEKKIQVELSLTNDEADQGIRNAESKNDRKENDEIKNDRIKREEITYDKLLIATGTSIVFPPIENLEGAGNVSSFKTLEDAKKIKAAAKKGKRFVVLGAGAEGMNCISGLLELGVVPAVVEKEHWMLIRRLDEKAALRYQEAFEKKGVEQYYGVGISSVVQDDRGNITEAVLTDGRRIPCDFLVITVERKPNVDFLEDSGVEVNSFGLVYDELGETSEEDVFGAGDVSGLHPIWPLAVKEGIAAANGMYGIKEEMVDFFVSKSTINYLGIPTFSLGNVNLRGYRYTVETEETEQGYKKIIHQNGKIEGALIQGELSYCTILQQLISLRVNISKIDKPVFEITYSDFFHTEDNFVHYHDDFY